MYIEQKQNRIYKPISNTTLSAEESNQVTTELQNLITAGGLTPNAGTLTQVRDSVQAVVNTSANALQAQIDAITSASDVFDVVGTYAQLQAYDTSTVPLNDIIKVLQDETRNNAMTYYRWNGTSWDYIGEEGPFYTVAETDATFAKLTDLPGIATNNQVGLVKPDGVSVTIQADGTLNVSSNVAASLPLFTSIWADHILNNASYLRADTFSWQSGAVYVSAYNHLVDDIDGITAETETISGTTITFYRATDGHKIVLEDQESNVSAIYTATGVAWYYILDTDNQRFKLPRENPAREELIQVVRAKGNGNGLGLTNGTNSATLCRAGTYGLEGGSVNDLPKTLGQSVTTGWPNYDNVAIGIVTDPTKSGIISDMTDVTSVYKGKKYLYFYVGNTVQDQTTIDVGEITDALNGKVDLPAGGTQTSVGLLVESYSSGTSWYRVYSDGWCEQGGIYTGTGTHAAEYTINLLKSFADTNYVVTESHSSVTTGTTVISFNTAYSKSAGSFTFQYGAANGISYSFTYYWVAKGYIA